MSKLIGVSLNLSKLDASNIIIGKTGDKYINLTISVNDEPDQYGKDVQVWNEQSKEQREAKEKKQYCGNGKVLFTGTSKPATTVEPVVEYVLKSTSKTSDKDDLPF